MRVGDSMWRGTMGGQDVLGLGVKVRGAGAGFRFCLFLSGSHFLFHAFITNGKTFTSRRMGRLSYESCPQALPPRSPRPLPILCSIVHLTSLVCSDTGMRDGLFPTQRSTQ